MNFFKSELLGIWVENQNMRQFADIPGCKVGSFPTTYLGLSLCIGRPLKLVWYPIIERVERKLFS